MKINVALATALKSRNQIQQKASEKDFIVRIQLANNENYDALHEAMAEQGFAKEIKTLDGKRRQLPDAEYFLGGQALTAQAEDVCVLAKKAIIKHGIAYKLEDLKAQFQVVQVADLWVDLPEVEEEA